MTSDRRRRLTVLSGGMGGARFLQGLLHGTGLLPGSPDAEVTVVANTADDLWVHGLKVCPDLDTVMYTLGDGIDHERGWGRRDETWSVKEELAAYGVRADLVRSRRPRHRHPPGAHPDARRRLPALAGDRGAVRALARPALGDGLRLLPMSDDRVETHIAVADADAPSGRRVVHFQEYWVRLRAAVPAEAVVVVGLDDATPAPGSSTRSTDADLVLLPPSNPVVSVGTILGVPGVREALRATTAPVVGLSPIVGGTHVRGMAEQLLTSIGVEVSAAGVGLHYGARSAGGVLDGWLVDTVDAELVAADRGGRARLPRAVPLLMTDVDATAAMAARRDRPGPSPVTGRSAVLLTAYAPTACPRSPPATTSPRSCCGARRGVDLADGDVVVVTSKVVSKAEGRVLPGDRDDALAGRDRAGRGPARARPRSCATGSGSPWPRPASTPPTSPSGRVVLLPVDPDASARRLRARAGRAHRRQRRPSWSTDTSGRAWREGQTDIAIGAAGPGRPRRPPRVASTPTATSWR